MSKLEKQINCLQIVSVKDVGQADVDLWPKQFIKLSIIYELASMSIVRSRGSLLESFSSSQTSSIVFWIIDGN